MDNNDRVINFAILKNRYVSSSELHNKDVNVAVEWEKFCKKCSHPAHVYRKDQCKVISASTLEGGRGKDHVRKNDILPVDVDDGWKIEEFIERFKKYEFVLYTSPSHTDESHRFRVFFLLKDTVWAHDIARRSEYLSNLFKCDESGFHLAHLQGAPCSIVSNTNYTFFHHRNEGETLDVLKAPENAVRNTSQDAQNGPDRDFTVSDIQTVRKMLEVLVEEVSEIEYPDAFVLTTALAVVYEGTETGMELVEEFIVPLREARKGDKYPCLAELTKAYYSTDIEGYNANPVGAIYNRINKLL